MALSITVTVYAMFDSSAQAQAGPTIFNVYPNGTHQFQSSSTLTFSIASSAGVAPSSIVVQLASTTLPGQTSTVSLSTVNGLIVSGSVNNCTVTAPLTSNMVYAAVIQATDANESTTTTNISFDTIIPGYTFEAEDFDYGGGSFINNPQTNKYSGLNATYGIDAQNSNFGGGGDAYRPSGLNTEVNGDIPRQAYGTGLQDYDVGWNNGGSGNWGNYTRTFPSGAYNVYMRGSSPNSYTADSASMYLVTSGRGTSSQTTQELGTFSIPDTGNWQVYTWIPLLDTNGNLGRFTGGSTETLRVSTDNGGYNANFYLLMPADTNQPVIGNLYPNGSSFFQYTNVLSFNAICLAGIATNSINVTMDGTAASGLVFSGSSTNWNVSCPLIVNTNHTVAIIITAENGNVVSTNVSFNDFQATDYQLEAEDYDYTSNGVSGLFSDSSVGAYAGLGGTTHIDVYESDANAFGRGYVYRAANGADFPDMLSQDQSRSQFTAAGKADYAIGSFGPGSWANYTRHYPAGTYNIWGRFAEGQSITAATLSLLTSGYGTTSQTTNSLGTFSIPLSGGWSTWEWAMLKDSNDNPVKVRLDGSQNTLQLEGSPVGSQPEANVNFLMLVPTTPVVLSVAQIFNIGLTNVQIIYSEPVQAASATNIANYAFIAGSTINAASLNPDGMTVILTTGPMTNGANYSIIINNVQDLMTLPDTIATNTTASFQALPYATLDIGNPAIASTTTIAGDGINVTASGSDFGGTNDQGNFSYQLYSGNFDVSVRVANLGLSDIFAKAGLMAREDLTVGGRFAAAMATPAMNGAFFEWRDPAYSTANTAGSFPANYPNTWLRLARSGNAFTAYAGYDGQTWTELGSDTISMSNQVYLGFVVTSDNTNAATTAEFRDFSNVTNAIVSTQNNPHDVIGPSSRKTPIVFSEIMWKPAARTDEKNLEYLELYNSNPWFQDISDYQITCADMNYAFPSNTLIPGGGYLVIAAAPGDVESVYGITNIMGPYNGSLKHSETLELLDEQSNVLLTVPYDDTYPWPVATDATGHSLVLANPNYGEGDPRAWDISDVIGGSPGQMDGFTPSPLRNVVINEILPHSENPAVPQFIELYNHSTNSVDVSGCILTDDPTTNKFVIPSGTIMGPAGFISFTQSQFGFTLNGAGETLYFIKPDNSRILDAVQFGAQADGVSYGRWPDGANDFYSFVSRTPGTNNSAIIIGDIVINELMYDPISGNDADQYIELYNKGTNTVDLAGWQFVSGVTFTFPNVSIAPNGYLVVADNITNLFTKYPNLNTDNTVGNYSGKLSHNGELLELAQPETLYGTNTIYVEEDEVAYGTGGRWGEWSSGNGSSLELIDPRSNHRLAANWTDSDDTSKSVWTNITCTGVLDNGANYGSSIDYAQLGLLDVGQCLVDNVQVNYNGSNYVLNSNFEGGNLNNWSLQGCHTRSSLQTPGYNSSYALCMRSSDKFWTGDNYCQVALANNNMGQGQTATISFEARWLHGWPEPLMRLHGNWLEATGPMPVPNNLGSPGMPNSTYITNAGPAIYNVTHNPPVPAANQPVVVTANVCDPNGVQNLTLYYRLDPSTSYIAVPMNDGGTNGDAVSGDGVFSATIPGQASNQVAAFYISASDNLGAATRFPALRPQDNEPARECVVMFGDSSPGGSFGVYHLWITQTNATRWANLGNLSNEGIDCTFVNGNRVIYNMQAHFQGSPYHQDFDTPYGALCHYKFIFNDDDKFLGATSFNKIHQPGNGPGDDPSLQREQLANTFLRTLGVPWLNRRYVVVYVNGNRRGSVMEDAQEPDSDMVKECFPNDTGGFLFKMQPWFEFAPSLSGEELPFDNESWCTLNEYTTTDNAKKMARYRYCYEIRRTPDSDNDFTDAYSLVDAANSYGTPNYVANMENIANMENWMRVFAANHAAGNWDSFGAQNGQNLYGYIGTLGTKYSLMMWDYNIVIGGSVTGNPSWGPGQNLLTVDGSDPPMADIYNTPVFLRMYWRALQELVNGPLNVANSEPLLADKYNVFTQNGFSVENPSANIEPWLSQAQSSIASQLAAINATSFTVNPIVTISNNIAYVTGTAPVNVDAIWINGNAYPLTWTSLINWTVAFPLTTGVNNLSVVGVDRNGQPIAGDNGNVSVNYSGTNPSPVGQVVINEIMYDPLIANAQFVELYNNSTNTSFDLSGWQLQGLSYTFPDGSIMGPASYLILAANGAAFAAAYGATNPVFDVFDGSLQPEQTLSLVEPDFNGTNLIVAEVEYDSPLPWPVNANGTGASLQLIDPHQDNWRVGNWVAGSPTPDAKNAGQTSLPPFPPLWINEIEPDNLTGITNQAGQHSAWLEIYNPSSTNVSLSGLYLANNYTNLLQWPFPTNASIAAGQFEIVFADGETNITNELHTSFALPDSSGSLALSRTYNGQPQVLDYLNYTNVPANESYGSFHDGQSFARQVFYYPTPGGPNAGSGVQPPSFINYNSVGMLYSQDFDSLPDPGASSVDAENPVTINGITYSLANPFDFAFPVASTGNGGLEIPSMNGWYGWAAATPKFGATDGDQTTGGAISFGPANGSNRALGLLATSSTDATAFGAKFINGTGANLNYIDVDFVGEIWRQSNTSKTIQFYYWIDPTGTNVWPTGITVVMSPLNINFATVSGDKGGVAVNGTSPANQENLNVFNYLTQAWPPGAALWIVGQMTDNTGKAQGLGIDNFNFSATTQPVTSIPPVTAQSSGNGISLNWSTVPGAIYAVQYKNNLTDPTWTTINSNQIGTGSPMSLVVNTSANSQRFYRVIITN
ncbi:MAG TPA: lamin tail domain-containing protein [Candidatus Acidoferrales bacterium]|nr:lamin tail domain-containing protein [Candidatus Acidoferrales bacterium]